MVRPLVVRRHVQGKGSLVVVVERQPLFCFSAHRKTSVSVLFDPSVFFSDRALAHQCSTGSAKKKVMEQLAETREPAPRCESFVPIPRRIPCSCSIWRCLPEIFARLYCPQEVKVVSLATREVCSVLEPAPTSCDGLDHTSQHI